MDKKKVAKRSLRIAAGLTTLGISELFLWADRTGKAAPQKLADAQRKELLKSSENFTKRMVVRTYGAKEQKRMEADGSALLENGYAMQGQSGFAESGGTTIFSIVTANQSKGQTTITYIKQPTKAKAKGR
jgi:hypothetical protein